MLSAKKQLTPQLLSLGQNLNTAPINNLIIVMAMGDIQRWN
jgi:hypothetical protein